MLEANSIINVKNIQHNRVGYIIPDLGNLHRNFMPGETKQVTFDELKKLSFTPGGRVILTDHLVIENEEALKDLLGKVEPEYFYSEEDVRNLLTGGTMEQFMDFLDFAPEGLIGLMKDLAISLEISDIRKREAIKKKTGFDVTKAIEFNNLTKEENENGESEKTTRRAEPINKSSLESEKIERRTAPKYKVVPSKE